MKKKIAGSDDWRDVMLSRIRALIREADPEVVEEVKWKKPTNPAGVPVWYHDGMICTGETYKSHLRLTFSKGHSLKESHSLIDSSRAMTIREGDALDEKAFKKLVRAAVALNRTAKKDQPRIRR